MEQNKTTQERINKEIIDLVIARLKTIPTDASLSVGKEGKGFTVDELIESVRIGDEIGKQVIETQLYFLRSLKDLPIEEHVSSNN
ncbi:MAG: hypothetical protein V1656_00030 [Candidatus Jorgensenbacteria bacterium]